MAVMAHRQQGTGSGTAKRVVPAAVIRELSQRNSGRAALAILRQWAVIAAAIVFAVLYDRWYGHVVGVLVIATRQHALAVLMHDGAHRLLFGHRGLNDVVSDVLLAFPLFVSTTLYRRHHLEHHRSLNSNQDPDLDTTSIHHTGRDWVRVFLGDLTGVNLLKTVDTLNQFSLLPLLRGDRSVARAMGRRSRNLFLVFAVVVAGALVVTGAWPYYLLFWALPALTALSFILRLRAIAEHVGCDPENGVGGTRTVLAGRIELLLFAPCNINYHLVHHLYPTVPFYNLRRLHQLVMKDDRVRARAHLTTAYLLGRDNVLRAVAAARAAGATQ